MFDNLVWGAAQWAWPAFGVGFVLAGITVWNYWRRDAPTAIRIAAATLKLLAIALVAICLVEPMRRGTRPRPQANILPVVVDTSQSMRVKTSGDDASRYENAISHMANEGGWLSRLAQSFDVRRYRFDRRLENVDDFSNVQADGNTSAMAGALASLSDRFNDRPVGGVILFTDGNMTDENSVVWSDLGFPVYPVVSSDDNDMIDMRIVDVSVRQTDFESAPTTIAVRIDAEGVSKQKVIVQLRQLGGKVIEEQTLSIGESDSKGALDATFRFRPDSIGVSFFTATVFAEADREAFESTAIGDVVSNVGEVTLINNRRIVTVNRESGPYRILYVAGRPNWEFKFLRRAMESDAEIQLVGLLRIANKEAKFSFRDRSVSDTNPLFAGLGKDEEEIASQYDEPVILRFGVKESEELSDGFPDSDEELFAYHGIVLDDIEPDFFSQDQLLRLRRFVSSRGGGLLMLGGQESFANKKFGDSPLGELSPVYASGSSVAGRESSPGRIALTREGLLQPWTRLRDTETAEEDRLKSMPPFMTINRVGEIKPGASRLATFESGIELDRPSTLTALAVQRFGKGRTAAIPVGDLWRWSMRRPAAKLDSNFNRGAPANDMGDGSNKLSDQRDDPEQAWRQTMHWLVGEVPRRVELSIETTDDSDGPVTLLVEARDEAFLPLENATVQLVITPVVGESMELAAQAMDSGPGIYSAKFWPRDGGGYLVRVEVKAADGSVVGSDSAGWTSQLDTAEFADLRLNRKLLEDIASQTGGEVIEESSLEDFAGELPNRKVPVTETWVYPLWHQTWVMIVAIACLCGEWGLRRWKGLA